MYGTSRKYLYPSLCFLFGVFLYFNTLNHEFVLDDDAVIVNNKDVKKGIAGIYDIFTHSYFHGFSNKTSKSARPVTFTTFAIQYQFSGSNPKPFHLVNILLYGLTGWVLFFFLSVCFNQNSSFFPFWVTLIFLSHPIHCEVVANIKSRDEMLAFLFGIVSLYYLLLYNDTRKVNNFIFAILFFIMAVLSKESALVFALIAPMTVYYFRIGQTRFQLFKIATIFLCTGFALWFGYFEQLGDPVQKNILHNSLVGIENYWNRFATATGILGEYVRLMVFPLNLSFNYGYNHIPPATWADYKPLLSFLLYMIFIVFFCISLKRRSIWGYGTGFFLITISIYSNLIFPADDTIAERFLYIPSLGFILFFIVTLNHLTNNIIKKGSVYAEKMILNLSYLSAILLFFLTGIFSYRTYSRCQDWKNNYTLFAHDVKIAPESARAHFSLGLALLNKAPGEFSNEQSMLTLNSAFLEFSEAVRIYPEYAEAYNNMGIAMNALNNNREAFGYFQKAILTDSLFAKPWYNAGNYYALGGWMDSAVFCYYKTIQCDSFFADAYISLINIMMEEGKQDISLSLITNGVKLMPDNALILNGLGAVLYKMNRINDAIVYFGKAVEKDTSYFDALINLGGALHETGDEKNAYFYLKRAERHKPGSDSL